MSQVNFQQDEINNGDDIQNLNAETKHDLNSSSTLSNQEEENEIIQNNFEAINPSAYLSASDILQFNSYSSVQSSFKTHVNSIQSPESTYLSIPYLFDNDPTVNTANNNDKSYDISTLPAISTQYQHISKFISILDIPVESPYLVEELCHPDILESCSYILIPLTTQGLPQLNLLTTQISQSSINLVKRFVMPKHTLPHHNLVLPLSASTASSLLYKISPILIHALLFTHISGLLPHTSGTDNDVAPPPSATQKTITLKIKKLIEKELGWISYFGGERAILPQLPLFCTLPQLQIIIDNISFLMSCPAYDQYTQTPQFCRDFQSCQEWLSSLHHFSQNKHQTTPPSSPESSSPSSSSPSTPLPQKIAYYFIPSHLFHIIFFPYALFLHYLLNTQKNLSFTQLVPFALPPPYNPTDSIALFQAIVPTVNNTFTTKKYIDPNTPDSGILEPSTVNFCIFSNSHEPRLSAALIFNPLDFYRGNDLVEDNTENNLIDTSVHKNPPLHLIPQLDGHLTSNNISSPFQTNGKSSSLQSQSDSSHSYWSRVFIPHQPSLFSTLLMQWTGYNLQHIILTPQCFFKNSHDVLVLPQPLQLAVYILTTQLGCGPIYSTEQYLPYTVQNLSESMYELFDLNLNTICDNQSSPPHSTTTGENAELVETASFNISNTHKDQKNSSVWSFLSNFTKTFNSYIFEHSGIIPSMMAAFLHTIDQTLSLTPQSYFEQPYRDVLQVPLQPLGHQLENATYEVFEADPIKYRQYRYALEEYFVLIYDQIMTKYKLWQKHHVQNNNITENDTENDIFAPQLSVCVLGAGRGPLITCCVEAAENTKIPIKLYAVEKNPYAFISLLHTVQRAGGTGNGYCTDHSDNTNNTNDEPQCCSCGIDDQANWAHLTLIESDMRSIIDHQTPSTQQTLPEHFPTHFHVVVSELLGSFGDNELSPECLANIDQILTGMDVSNLSKSLKPINEKIFVENIEKSKSLPELTQYLLEYEVINDDFLMSNFTSNKNMYEYIVNSVQGYNLPCFYRNWLAPIVATHSHNQISSHNLVFTQPANNTVTNDNIVKNNNDTSQFIKFQKEAQINKMLHTPYVVMLHNHSLLASPQPAMDFHHPEFLSHYQNDPIQNKIPIDLKFSETYIIDNHKSNMDHNLCRYINIQFVIPGHLPVLLHGFAGYFETLLYDELSIGIQHWHKIIQLFQKNNTKNIPTFPQHLLKAQGLSKQYKTIGYSILPSTFSHGMFSWFPLFFPLQSPLLLPPLSKNTEDHIITVHMWRKCDGKRVWYEYCCEEQGLIHNWNGTAYSIGL